MTCSCSVCGTKLNAVVHPDVDVINVAPCAACLRVMGSISGAPLLAPDDSRRTADAAIEAINAVRWQFENSIAEVSRHFLSK